MIFLQAEENIIRIPIIKEAISLLSFIKAALRVCRLFLQRELLRGFIFGEESISSKLKKGVNGELPVVLCSLGDASITEGEVSEAFQFAVLKQLPIIYLIQDNNWGISVTAEEARAMNAFEFAAGFKGMNRVQVDGSDFEASYEVMKHVFTTVRKERKPWLVHAQVSLLGHHTSGVRKDFYRTDEDWAKHSAHCPNLKLRKKLADLGVSEDELLQIENEAAENVANDFSKAVASPEPDRATVEDHVFVPTPVTEEKGVRTPVGAEKVMMVDAALFAIRELMEAHPETRSCMVRMWADD